MGCYEHVVREGKTEPVAPWEMPAMFYFTDRLQGLAPSDGKTVALRWVAQTHSYRASGHWRLKDANTIHVVWTTGLQGISVELRRGSGGEMWTGRTVPFSDDGRAAPSVEVSIKKVADAECDAFR